MRDGEIKIINLGKKYQLGERQPYYSLREALEEFIARRKKTQQREEIWALKEINLDLKPGETLGIIGRNGAGKSTLLKILSRITPPTRGRVELHGRVASLLEVGTGFHPELTGRENIYLNGAILGMKKKEINERFDEIVAFAEIEKFLDTPVKRYSSGMYVRLAFAVAAHLEAEILLVDEVLAVGDAEFAKKCLGKMSDVSSQGRTVIFVSHNMAAVSRLCTRTVWLDKGRVVKIGKTDDVISEYIKGGSELVSDQRDLRKAARWPGNKERIMTKISLSGNSQKLKSIFSSGEDMTIKLDYRLSKPMVAYMQITITNEMEERVVVLRTQKIEGALRLRGKGVVWCRIPQNRFLAGVYTIMVEVGKDLHDNWQDCVPEAIKFRVNVGNYLGNQEWGGGRKYGFIAQKSEWKCEYE